MVQVSSALGFGVFGLAVVAERVEAGELVVEAGVPGRAGRVLRRLRGPGPVQGPSHGGVARRAVGGRDAGEGAVEQAHLGLPSQRVRGQDLDRAHRPGR